MAPEIRGNSLYTIVQGPSWAEAELNAQAIGGTLAEISDQSENIFLQSSQLVSGVGASLGVWIGLTRKDGYFADGKTYGDWLWTSGNLYGSGNEVVGWNQDFFASGDGMGNEAVHMYTNQTLVGSWNDVPLGSYSLGELDSGIAEIPITLSITRTGNVTEGAGPFTTSINLSAGSTSNLANGTTVHWSISGITADDLYSGSLSGSGVISNGKLDIQHSLKVDSDSGEHFSVSVFSDSALTQQIGTTSSTLVQDANNNGNGTPGAITGSGVFREGVTLTAPVVTGDPDGMPTNPNYKYQWYKDGNIVAGATASTYAVPASGAGTYKVAVTYTDAQEFTATVDSPNQVISVFNNGNGTPGAITGSGVFREGVTLTAPVVTGDPDGMPTNPNYKYQWYKNNSAISSATGKTYKVPTTGSGTYRVAVTYRDAQDFTATVNSANQFIAKVLTGTASTNTLVGTVGDDLITGLGGADRLTGSAGADTFRYAALSDSILAAYDRIADFVIGTDIFDAPRAVSSTDIKQLGRVTALTQAGIEMVLGKSNSSWGKQVFASHRAATFTVGTGGSVRTFLGVNDATAGFDQRFDALVEITGYSGSLANLVII